MASGRVDAGPPILKTLQSPQIPARVYPPLTPPSAPARPSRGSLGKSYCLLLLLYVSANIQYFKFCFYPKIIKIFNFCSTYAQKRLFLILR